MQEKNLEAILEDLLESDFIPKGLEHAHQENESAAEEVQKQFFELHALIEQMDNLDANGKLPPGVKEKFQELLTNNLTQGHHHE
jgi:hypothetical protein